MDAYQSYGLLEQTALYIGWENDDIHDVMTSYFVVESLLQSSQI